MSIKTFADWKKEHGTNFRLLKDERERGLSREDALAERVSQTEGYLKEIKRQGTNPCLDIDIPEPRTLPRASRSRKGDILIRIRPEQGVNSEYFEQLPKGQLEVVLDEKFYSWLDTKLDTPYDGNINLLMKHVLDLGIGEVISRFNFADDLK